MAHFGPYEDPGLNNFYNMLFADDPGMLQDGAQMGPPYDTLYQRPANVAALRKAAEDASHEARFRLLAFQRLRQSSVKIDRLDVLGIVIEVPQERGLDTFAAYVDGPVRYINQTGSPVILEERAEMVGDRVADLMRVTAPLARQLNPAKGEREAPPRNGIVRITVLTSQGPHVTQAPIESVTKDRLTGPVMTSATDLLEHVVELAGA
jgi:hypothetical protein